MPVVIAVWPNNTISVLKMPAGFTASALFGELDAEANPTDATIYICKTDEDGFLHVGWNYVLDPGRPVEPSSKGLRIDCLSGRVKKWKWPPTVVRDYYRSLAKEDRRANAEASARTMTAEELKSFPAPPDPLFTVDEIRSMDRFCGVYFAFDTDGSCHYVGESLDVTTRVSKCRKEIGDRMIGVLRCEMHERKRIESYFIGLLDPPGNSQSTANQRAAQKAKLKTETAKDGRRMD